MKGKEKCKILKEIRAQIAAANEIEWVTDNCTHKGECRGTCPRCEAEVEALEKALARRRAMGKTVAVAGLSAGLIVSTSLTSSCALRPGQTVEGDMAVPRAQVENTSERSAPGSIETEQTDATTPEVLDGDITDVVMEMGEVAPIYYYTDFELQDARTFEANENLYTYGVIMEENGDPLPDSFIPAGKRFEVVGTMEYEIMWLIRYEDAYFSIYGSDLYDYAHEVTE